jgi:PmbA protein
VVISDAAARALARARSRAVEQVDVYLAESRSDSVGFENNRLAQINSGSSRGIGVRVISGGRIGFSSTSILERVEETVDAAIELARLAPVEKVAFDLPGHGPDGADLTDPEVDGITVDHLVELGRKAVDRLRGLADGVLAGASAARYRGHIEIANSAGLAAAYDKSGWHFQAVATRVEGTSVLTCYDGSASAHRDIDTDAVIEETAGKLRRSLREGRLQPGRHPVVFTPAALNALLSAIRIGVSGTAVYRGISPLLGRLGQRVLSAEVTLHDDLRPETGRAGAPFDDEGLPADRRTVFEAGVLGGFLCDLRHAARLGQAPGRASRAAYASMPYPGNGNLLMEPGPTPLASLMARAEGGIVVDALLGMHGSNLANGDFSANVGLGFAIGSGGETLYRVKDAAIAGNVYRLLADDLLGLSAERRWSYGGGELLPWALCAEIATT